MTPLLFSLLLLAQQPRPVEVMILGAYHFGNPGLDISNVKVDDVLASARQKQIQDVVDALAKFQPTKVAVEARTGDSPALASYRAYRSGQDRDKRNEIQQIGFRLADKVGHAEAYGIDVEGEFPFEAVQAYAKANGKEPVLQSMLGRVDSAMKEFEARQATSTVGALLRSLNEPARIQSEHGFYMSALQFGAGAQHPGATLVAAWYARNLGICARLVQIAQPGDRILVLYGSGHSYLLRRCVEETPGFRLVEPNGFLPR